MKKDISKIKFKSVVGFRRDSLTCPQAFGGDVFAGCNHGGCQWFCFIREMEEELYSKYYDGWTRELVRSCDPEEFRKLFDRAFGSDKPTDNWFIKCFRQKLPFNMGSKAETFCREDFDENVVVPVLEIFKEYKVPMIIETKSHYVGLQRYMDLLKDMDVVIIVSIMGGTDTLNYKLEPNAPVPSMRWALVKELNSKGIRTGVRWEPILIGINSQDDYLEDYAKNALQSGAFHVSFYNYRSSNPRKAQEEFEKRGYNYIRLLERNLDEEWKIVGEKFKGYLTKYGVPNSTPDFINFPFNNSCESCCGVDRWFTPYQFTFQHACKIIQEKGSVSWDDMEEIDFREPDAYSRLKGIWNGEKTRGYFTLKDSPEIMILDKDKDGRNIYGRKKGSEDRKRKAGFFI